MKHSKAVRRSSRRERGRDPVIDKVRSYRKDSRFRVEDPQQFRRAWPRKKALRNRALSPFRQRGRADANREAAANASVRS